eukprot:gene9757-2084_t
MRVLILRIKSLTAYITDQQELKEIAELTPLVDEIPKYHVDPDSDFSPSLEKAVVKVSKELSGFSINDDDLELQQQIGSGSSGTVYKGNYLGSTVAVKRCLIVDLLDDPLKDFMSETTLMSRLRHPNVVQFLGAAIKPPYFYIVSEFCSKGSLETLMKQEKLDLELKFKMLFDTALGLLYLSKHHIIHRDLKLGNLLVDRNYRIKVADFGASRMIKMKETKMTKVGTIETSAPEVLKDGTYCIESDVYSFGIVMWELFFELPLYPNLNVYELTTKVIVDSLRPNIPDETSVPKELKDLMQKCWKTDPSERPEWVTIVRILKNTIEQKFGRKSISAYSKIEI